MAVLTEKLLYAVAFLVSMNSYLGPAAFWLKNFNILRQWKQMLM
jgi:hypothetical protein